MMLCNTLLASFAVVSAPSAVPQSNPRPEANPLESKTCPGHAKEAPLGVESSSDQTGGWVPLHRMGPFVDGVAFDKGGIRTLCHTSGIGVEACTAQGWYWGLDIQSYRRGGDFVALGPAEPTVHGDAVLRDHGLVVEWLERTTVGIEHGFELRCAPPKSIDAVVDGGANDQPLCLALSTRTSLVPQVQEDGRSVVFSDCNGSPRLTYCHLSVFDALGRRLPAKMEVCDTAITMIINDDCAVFPITVDPLILTPEAKLEAVDAFGAFEGTMPGGQDLCGYSVAIDGNTALMSAHFLGSGSVYAFTRNGTSWTREARIDYPGVHGTTSSFGWSVALSGDTAIIGARVGQSRAYVYTRSMGSWSLAATLMGTNTDQFGFSVAISADQSTVVVGANAANSNTGTAYVFVDSGGVWTQQAQLVDSQSTATERFGQSVAIYGNTIMVGAPDRKVSTLAQAGAVCVFTRTGSTWTQRSSLTASVPTPNDRFGLAVAMQGTTALIGAPSTDVSTPGKVYVFTFGSSWTELPPLLQANDNGGTTDDEFGASVALSGSLAVIGAPFATNGIVPPLTLVAGAAYVFRYASSWTQEGKLQPDVVTALDEFGRSVAVSNDRIIVGDPSEDHASLPSSGSAFVFVASFPSYCTAGTTSNGCIPAISSAGMPSASASSGFSISIANVEGQKSGLIFYGLSGAAANPWGTASTSYLCVKSPTQRTPVQNSGGSANQCNGVLALDWTAFIATTMGALGNPFMGGETVWAQGWFRDPPAPKTTNLSDGLEFVVSP